MISNFNNPSLMHGNSLHRLISFLILFIARRLFGERRSVFIAGIKGVPVAVNRKFITHRPIRPGARWFAAVLHGCSAVSGFKSSVGLGIQRGLYLGKRQRQFIFHETAPGDSGKVFRAAHPLYHDLPVLVIEGRKLIALNA
jgi:hypothetical protein